ncbi:MAG: hypothetical protein LBS94_02655 [Prevotellaceae bacterium]|jgi:hypothetical protein|nr:hypothetical protein [Prevotellaceae bacterium]
MHKRYPIRIIKYVVYFYVFFFLLHLAVHLFSEPTKPLLNTLSGLIQPRLLIGLGILALGYPLFAFKKVTEPLPRSENTLQDLCQIMADLGYKRSRSQNDTHIFRAISPARRVLTMFEDDITLALNPDGTLTISGLRKEVARIRLKVNDYVKRGLD